MIVIVEPTRGLSAGPSGRMARKRSEGIGPDHRLHKAARKVLKRTLRTLRETARSVDAKAGARPLVVHQLRVSTRRLDAALGLFEPCLPRSTHKQFRALSRRLRRAAGRVRRYDVMLDMLGELGIDSTPAEQQSIKVLMDDLRTERVMARRDLTGLLGKGKVRKLLESGVRHLNACRRPRGPVRLPDGSSAGKARTMADAANALLPAWSALFESSRISDHPTIEELHELRLVGKRVRYTLEILGPSIEPGAFAAAYAQMEQLQERLGVLNDHCELVDLLRVAAESGSTTGGNGALEGSHPLTMLVEQEEQRCRELQEQFLTWWRGTGGEALVRLMTSAGDHAPGERSTSPEVSPEPPLVETALPREITC